MKKLFILLFISLVLTSCSNDGEMESEQTDSFSNIPQQDIVINVTDAAFAKMNFELIKSKIEGEIYRIDFSYSSAG